MKTVLFLGTAYGSAENLSALWIDQSADKEIKKAYVFNGSWDLSIDKNSIYASGESHPRSSKIYVIHLECESSDYNIVIEEARKILKFNIENNVDCEYKF